MTPQIRATIDPFTFVPIRLDVMFESNTLATGTCFIYKHNGADYLITNRHIVTGKHNDNGEILDDVNKSLPDHLALHVHGTIPGSWGTLNVPLYSDDNRQKPNWLIHPEHCGKVDVVALPLPPLQIGARFYPITDRNNTPDVDVTIAMDVFIIGFPEGLSGGLNFPIWKRATVASEPDLDVDDLPRLLVDSATRPGMSGSPVIWTSIGNTFDTSTGDFVLDSGPASRRIGVYSGRTSSKVNDAQIGYVWKDHVIGEIIDGGVLEPISPHFS